MCLCCIHVHAVMWPDLGSQVFADIAAYGTCPRGTISGCHRIQPTG